jgi:hypothetical protein
MEALLGPKDAEAARRTDPESLNARFGRGEGRIMPLDGTIRGGSQAEEHLARWFGPRLYTPADVTAAESLKRPALVASRQQQRCALSIGVSHDPSALAVLFDILEQTGLKLCALGLAVAADESDGLAATVVLEGLGLRALRPALIAHVATTLQTERRGAGNTSLDAVRVWDVTPDGDGDSLEGAVYGAPPQRVVQTRLSPFVAHTHRRSSGRNSGTLEQGHALATPCVPTAAVVAISGPQAAVLARLLRAITNEDGLALMGFKVLPEVEMFQAREVTPFEVGDKRWKSSLATISK